MLTALNATTTTTLYSSNITFHAPLLLIFYLLLRNKIDCLGFFVYTDVLYV